jgi:hypothetical protein
MPEAAVRGDDWCDRRDDAINTHIYTQTHHLLPTPPDACHPPAHPHTFPPTLLLSHALAQPTIHNSAHAHAPAQTPHPPNPTERGGQLGEPVGPDVKLLQAREVRNRVGEGGLECVSACVRACVCVCVCVCA